MDRWVTIGALNSHRWEPIGGAVWKQRAGRIMVEGFGSGFGGRTLCLLKDTPELPVEIEVDVRLHDERGAAGLAIHGDGGHRHYGFYPSAGHLRFTRFDGPDVNHWTILHNEPHPAYQGGQWNTLKVRVDTDSIECFINGEPVFSTQDSAIPAGRPGFAAFRGTQADFRSLTIAPSIPSRQPSPAQQARVNELLEQAQAGQPLPRTLVDELQPLGDGVAGLLEKNAAQLEARATQIRQLADDVHTARILKRLRSYLHSDAGAAQESSAPDLLRSALLLARLDNPEVRIEDYVARVDAIAAEIRDELAENVSEQQRLEALDRWLFEQNGFRGSRQQYYSRSNSYLNEVIDDREGLPVALSVLYMELARRFDLQVHGIGLPGHFITQFAPQNDQFESEWIDVFDRGTRLSESDLEQLVRNRGLSLQPSHMEPQTPEQIIERMLMNLLGLAERDRDDRRVLRYLELLVGISDDNPEFRAKRLEMRARTGHPDAALEDADWFIQNRPHGVNLRQLQLLKADLESKASGR